MGSLTRVGAITEDITRESVLLRLLMAVLVGD